MINENIAPAAQPALMPSLFSPADRHARRRADAAERWSLSPTSSGDVACVDCGLLLSEQVMLGCVDGLHSSHNNWEFEPGEELPEPTS